MRGIDFNEFLAIEMGCAVKGVPRSKRKPLREAFAKAVYDQTGSVERALYLFKNARKSTWLDVEGLARQNLIGQFDEETIKNARFTIGD